MWYREGSEVDAGGKSDKASYIENVYSSVRPTRSRSREEYLQLSDTRRLDFCAATRNLYTILLFDALDMLLRF
jgi:hypothetical protein